MLRRSLLTAALGAALLAPAANAAEHVPGEVVVRYQGQDGGLGHTEVVEAAPGETVRETAQRLREQPRVLSATKNVIARAALIPDDPGREGVPGGWQTLQWNFAGPFGVNAPAAWDNLAAAGRPGGQGVVVAVLDTGVAYADRDNFVRSPDLARTASWRRSTSSTATDYPHDLNGHGTHVASTIAESIDNQSASPASPTACRSCPARARPERRGRLVRDREGHPVRRQPRRRRPEPVLRVRLADPRAADPQHPRRGALRDETGAVVVGAAGQRQGARGLVSRPRAGKVISVGATTEHGCVAKYSNQGPQLDLVAPGGGPDADLRRDPNCRPLAAGARHRPDHLHHRRPGTFGLPGGYRGTSMAAPHVSATAALVIASGVLGPDPRRGTIKERLLATARDLGPQGPDNFYGAGLVDAAAGDRAASPAAP